MPPGKEKKIYAPMTRQREGEADQNGTDRTDPQHPPCGRQAEAEVDQEPAAEACVAALALHVLD